MCSVCAGIANEKQRIYGVQFHPEVDLTENGKKMFSNFLFDVAQCEATYTMESREARCINYIQETVGNHKVLVRSISVSVDHDIQKA